MSDQPKDQPEFEAVVDDGVEVNWPELEGAEEDDAVEGEGPDGRPEPDRD